MSKWMINNKKADFDGLAKKFNISVITARLIANRLINSKATEEADCTFETVDNSSLKSGSDKLKILDLWRTWKPERR